MSHWSGLRRCQLPSGRDQSGIAHPLPELVLQVDPNRYGSTGRRLPVVESGGDTNPNSMSTGRTSRFAGVVSIN